MKGIRIDTFVAVKKIRGIFSIAMIAVLLFSSVGFSVNRHYCMGMLMDESFYSLPDDCGMQTNDTCEKPASSIDMGCCDDENLAFAGIDVISSVKKQLSFSPANVAPLRVSLAALSQQNSNHTKSFVFPPPEPLPYGRNLLVQVQRFLI